MKKRIAGVVVAGALLFPAQMGAAFAAPAAPVVASEIGSSDLGCTSNTNPTCPSFVKLLVDLLSALGSGSGTGSSKGGGAPSN